MRCAAIAARLIGLSSASLALTTLCACGLNLEKILPSEEPTLPNREAIDRALRLCALTEADRPFHIILTIAQPPVSSPAPSAKSQRPQPSHHALPQRTQIEIYWLNAFTYRTEIHSPDFTQTRIVNGSVVEEHNTGAFYPRWIQNFVDAILEPIPHAASLRKIPGSIPVSHIAHACISNSAHPETTARICFQDSDPKIASGLDAARYVAFTEFAPFGSQQIARTLVNVLSANTLIRGRVIVLEPLPSQAYTLVKAREFTPAARQIQTTLVPELTAQSLLNDSATPGRHHGNASSSKVERTSLTTNHQPATTAHPGTIYIRTDRTGKVREAYSDSSDFYGLQNAAIARALTLKFKPLVINGVPHQMEAPITLP
jgi:hypothetical protein